MWDLKKCEFLKFWDLKNRIFKNKYNQDLKSLEIGPNPSAWFCETIKHTLFLKSHPPNLRRIPGEIMSQWQRLQSIVLVTSIPFDVHTGGGQVGQNVCKWNAV